MAKSNDSDFYKDVAFELKEYNEWIDRAFQSLMQKYKYACQDNDNLRSKIEDYQSGMRDPEMVQARISDHKWHNENSVGGAYQVKGYKWEMPVSDDSSDIPNIPLSDIVDLCSTDAQKEVAAYYYDEHLDCYGSLQKTGIALGKSRQCIYDHVKAIKKVIAAKFNK